MAEDTMKCVCRFDGVKFTKVCALHQRLLTLDTREMKAELYDLRAALGKIEIILGQLRERTFHG